MECGFETIGNATLICHDAGPVLCTDPWIVGGAYFGSWTLSHDVPPEQLDAVRACPFVWLSHGHPDHLSGESLELLRGRTMLLPDHVGGRVRQDLASQGFRVRVLKDRVWTSLSPRIRVLSIADYNQDGVLLVDVAGKLVVNLNDASDRGWGLFVRRVLASYDTSFLLALTGFGDAAMINYFDESGRRIAPVAARRRPVGQKISRLVDRYPARYFVPFSSMHRYQREDSLWADPYSTRLGDYAVGFESRECELLPAFIRYDALKDRVERLDPPEKIVTPLPPKAFGDDWQEPLEKDDVARLGRYFRAIEHLADVLDFVNLRVAGRDHIVSLGSRSHRRGLTFEAPRHSLMTAVQFEIFDDLLIGNFVKTIRHGQSPVELDADFTPWVAKYADNGRAKSHAELRAYFEAYRSRDALGYLRQKVERGYVRPLQETASVVLRERLGSDSRAFRAAKKAYWSLRRSIA